MDVELHIVDIFPHMSGRPGLIALC